MIYVNTQENIKNWLSFSIQYLLILDPHPRGNLYPLNPLTNSLTSQLNFSNSHTNSSIVGFLVGWVQILLKRIIPRLSMMKTAG